MNVELMEAGCVGVISVTANVVPAARLYVKRPLQGILGRRGNSMPPWRPSMRRFSSSPIPSPSSGPWRPWIVWKGASGCR